MILEILKTYGNVTLDKTFKDITTLKMGGKIKYFFEPNSFDDLKKSISFLKQNNIFYKVVGNGSNLLCGPLDFDGVVVSLKKFNKCEAIDNYIYADAGCMAPVVSKLAQVESLKGLEFIYGIPGTMGGLVYMNAGAYKSEIKDVIESCTVLIDDEIIEMNKDEMKFRYRGSFFQDHPRSIILSVKIKLEKADSNEILELMQDRLQRRKASQPLTSASAGSTFVNPDKIPAWKIIEDLGYRGYQKNGIEISTMHCNFIINKSLDANANDFLDIVYMLQKQAKQKYDVNLILEVEKFNC